MKTKDWIYVAAAVAAFVLGALLFRGCQKPKTSSPEIRWRVLDLDSLKAAWGYSPDTVFLPGPERQVVRYVTVSIPDQRAADSLAARYAELANRYSQLEAELQAAWSQGQGDLIEWGVEQHTYIDSITTPQYFHRWEIVAEGPIVSYVPQIIPFCPPAPAPKAAKMHRIGAWMGVQTGPTVSPVVGLSYRNRYFFTTAGYLPTVKAFQAGVGIDVGVK
jgi:hypothetical protein